MVGTQTILIGKVYPVGTGIGVVGCCLDRIFFIHEAATFWKIFLYHNFDIVNTWFEGGMKK